MGRGEQVLSFVPDPCGRARKAALHVGGPAVCARVWMRGFVCMNVSVCMSTRMRVYVDVTVCV